MTHSTFPYRLHGILEEISKTDEESSIVSWTPNGRTFRIHDLDAFNNHILPKYFPKQNKYKSFRRQLQYYGFCTIGRNHFGHSLFVRHQKHLLPHMKHKKGHQSSTGASPQLSAENELAALTRMLDRAPLKPLPLRTDERIAPRNICLVSPSTRLADSMEALLELGQASVPPSASSSNKISSHLRRAQSKSTGGLPAYSRPHQQQFVDPAEEGAMRIKRQLDLDILLLTLQRQKVAKEYATSVIKQRTNSALIDLAPRILQLGL